MRFLVDCTTCYEESLLATPFQSEMYSIRATWLEACLPIFYLPLVLSLSRMAFS
jgi:hypothetical protein